MNRTFGLGLVAAVVGLAAGAGFRLHLAVSGTCAGVFGAADSARPCTSAESWSASLGVFSLVTLGLGIVFGLLATRRHTQDEGYVALGDAFLAVGTLVSLVEVAVFASFGVYLGIAYGVVAVALTLFALTQDRQTALAVCTIMSLFVLTWVTSDPGALILGVTPAAMWLLGALAYVSSLKLGESLVVE